MRAASSQTPSSSLPSITGGLARRGTLRVGRLAGVCPSATVAELINARAATTTSLPAAFSPRRRSFGARANLTLQRRSSIGSCATVSSTWMRRLPGVRLVDRLKSRHDQSILLDVSRQLDLPRRHLCQPEKILIANDVGHTV